jgi:hypothetical protein
MSPLHHKDDDGSDGRRHGHLPSLYDLVPYIQQTASDIAATPLEQFATQLMTRYFIPEYVPESQIPTVVTINQITWDMLPDNSGERLGQQTPDAFIFLEELVIEAVQLLQNAGLVMERRGLATTRRGRQALAAGTVGQILGQVYARHA